MSRPTKAVYDNILATIGNTPLLFLEGVNRELPDGVSICAKLEMYNPGRSVKDRAAYRMIKDAEDSGALTRDKTIIDSTSGNTGIAYAMIGAVSGYRVKIVIPKNASIERKKIISAFGAEIVYSSPFDGSDGAIRYARKLYNDSTDIYYMPDQYNNPSNWKAHYLTTGPEIIQQTKGRITHLIASVGTGGTIMGTGKALKEFNPNIRVIAIQPDDAMHGIEGLKHMASSIVPGIYDLGFPDDTVFVNTDDAYDWVKRLVRTEGLAVGHSSGAALAGAVAYARTLTEGVIVAIFPDGGDRYLSHVI
ncbi:cysteine synthase, O-acetylserine (thiol) lyase B [Candidatus Magnetobacterium bavaricum]|uniref:Cysteine synthase, O-acetylserine (Thiol) lyase B n=1 Tax=Candidatus Magnetobacterium bavaricum TaxID=29290 RepID=A0A0F3GWD0_9BACT|nr:cysteine synthase, O-acetylserine (thiol) lyase B [Candidatus Magnetobacterium bavaricum]